MCPGSDPPRDPCRPALPVLLLLAAACGPADPPPAPLDGFNVVLINVDTLRADHLGCYGYGKRETSPYIDRLAAEGVRFERAYSNSSYTRTSVAALFTGRLPTSAGSVGWSGGISPDADTLAERFRRAGYSTGFFSNTVMLRDESFTQGFEAVAHLAEISGISRAGPLLSAEAVGFLRQHQGDRFLLYLHYLDPHAPYDPPPDVLGRFTDEVEPDPLRVIGDVRPDLAAYVADGFGPGEQRFEEMVLRYDAEIFDTDQSIAMVVGELARLGLEQKTLIVLTADHGEEFLEHGFIEHAWTLYEESLRVPLIFRAPGALAPRVVAGPVSSIDVLPTVLDLTGLLREDERSIEGRALLAADAPADGAILAELTIRERQTLRAVIEDGWKYVAVYRWLEPEERSRIVNIEPQLRRRRYETALDPWPEVIREELYRLSSDPGERSDVSGKEPQQLERLRARLDEYRAACERGGLAPAAVPEAALTPEEESRLRALGYL